MLFVEDWQLDLLRLSDIYMAKELDIQTKARERAEYDVAYKQYAELYRLTNTSNVITQRLNEARQARDQRALDEIGFYFITISPRDTTPYHEFKKAVDKYTQRKWVRSYVYVYEQRGMHDQELGKGIHMHMILVKPEKNFARLLKETKNTFKDLIDDNCSSAIDIDGRYLRDLKNSITYILGKKKDPTKQLKQEMDKLWREKYNIKEYYVNNFSIPSIEDASPT